MQIPASISKFSEDVHTAMSELSNLVAKHNQMVEYRQKISEIPREYLRVQPIESPEALRRFILDGIGVEITCLEGQIRGKIGEIYSIADNYVRKHQ